MTETFGALGFLVARTTRNQIRRQVGRLRNPRYAIGFLVAAGYLILLGLGTFTAGDLPPVGMGAGAGEGLSIAAGLGLAFAVVVWWLGASPSQALAFQPAEVQLLFPGPISRRGLLGYRIARLQVVILFNAVLWTLLIRRFGWAFSAPLRLVTAWAIFSVLSFHRLGIALLRVEPLSGLRRAGLWTGRILSLGVVGSLTVWLGSAAGRFREGGFEAGIRALAASLREPPASIALVPFRAVVAPLRAASWGEWVAAFAVLAAILAAQVAWILAMHRVEFEELAAQASAERSRIVTAFRERGLQGMGRLRTTKARRAALPLSASGHPAIALIWKNLVALTRTQSWGGIVLLLILVGVISLTLATGKPGAMELAPLFTVFVMSVLLGPRAIRNDLRADLLSLSLLKTYPLSGTVLVAAEVAGPVIALTAFQLVVAGMALLLAPAEIRGALLSPASALLAGVLLPGLVCFNALGIAIQNGLALLFPGWVRLGSGSAGIEAMGQSLLTMFGSLFALLIALVLPAGASLAIFFGLAQANGTVAVLGAAAAGGTVLGLEVILLVRGLGAVFERYEL